MRRAGSRKRFIPSFDILEGRTVPAGNITSTFFEGHLRLEGDDEANQIRIVPSGTGGVTITALDGDTTINGQDGPFTVNATVKGLAVALGDGDDVLQIDGLFLGKDLAVNGNAGNDTITIDNTTVRYRGFIFGKDGDDTISITSSSFRREIQMFMGDGDDVLNLTSSRFGKHSVVHGGAGEDTLNGSGGNRFGEHSKVLSFEHRGTPSATLEANDDTATVAKGGTVNVNVAANDTAGAGATLDLASITITQQPTHGTVTVNNDGTVTYTHDNSTATTDSFKYTIKNSNGDTSNAATVSLTVSGTGNNAAPVANNDTATVAEGGTAIINVAANDTDSDGTINPASIVIFQNPVNGTVTVNNDGTVTYIHNGSETTTDSFQYTIKDDDGTVSNVATVTVTITPTNDAPTAVNDTAQVTSGGTTTINVAANDTDSDGTLDLTTVTITQQPVNGTATANSDGTVTYTHNGSATTTDTFKYTIKDNSGNTSNAATVTVAIGNAPVANNDTATVAEGGNVNIPVSTNDTDSDGTINPATIVITQQPANGSVTVNSNGSVTYTHNGSETTSDTFKYTIKDNQGLVSNAATVTVTITPVNDAPTANNDTLFVTDGGSATFNVTTNDTDPDGTIDPASVTITQQPTLGSVTVNGDGTVTYTRSGPGTAADAFQYTVKDNTGATSNVATVTVTVDTPPVANDDTATVAEGGSTSINVAANDTDSDGTINPASIVIVTQPVNGLVTVNNDGTVTYVHDGSETTSDSFTYTIRDNAGAPSNTATVAITVTPVNDAPVANDDTGDTTPGGVVIIPVAANDTDADGTLDPASITIVTPPAHGTAVANADGTITYTHDGSATTTDTFDYTIKDNLGIVSNVATVTVTISLTNQAPVANDDAAFVTPFGQAFINVAVNDTDADGTIDPATIVITQDPAHGTVIVNADGTVTYVNDDPGAGTDSFQYTIKDDQGATSNAATVTVTVNLAPVANDDAATVDQGAATTIDVLGNDADVDGTLDTGSVTIVTPPQHGTAVVNPDGTITYTHDGTSAASDIFTYTVEDNNGIVSNPAAVSITVNFPNNTPPVANGDVLFTPTGGSATVNVLANDFDLDGSLDPATVTVTIGPTHGTFLVNADGTITYTHTGGGGGFDSFRYTVLDSFGAVSNEASVSVFIHDAPVAADDGFTLTQGDSAVFSILSNDTATGGATIDAATVMIVQSPTHGTLTINSDGTVTYLNDGAVVPSDTFSYTVKDTHGLTSNLGTVAITLLPAGGF